MPVPTAEWRPTDAERADLGPRAIDWLDAALGLYQFDLVEGQRLMASLRTLTRIEAIEDAIGTAGVADAAGAPHALLPALAREQRIFLSQWAALQLGRP
jgi:hypothetical protein